MRRGIIMSGPDVRRILSGKKTQFRIPIERNGVTCDDRGLRVCADANGRSQFENWHGRVVRPPYGVPGGSPLWVRETWCHMCDPDDDSKPRYNASGNLDNTCVWYRADRAGHVRAVDGDGGTRFNKDGSEASPWISPARMPEWACRIDLIVTVLSTQRVSSMTIKEFDQENCVDSDAFMEKLRTKYRRGFEDKGLNTWVWCYEFKARRV